MKRFFTIFILSFLLAGTSVMAGSGHSHGFGGPVIPVDESAAERNAGIVIASLVSRGKVDESWGAVKANSIEKQTLNGKPEWVVVYVNKNITNIEKQKLYVFLTESGSFIAVNYTGK
jgi:hypothetical protein